MDLSSVAFIPEAHDLISRLLKANPKIEVRCLIDFVSVC